MGRAEGAGTDLGRKGISHSGGRVEVGVWLRPRLLGAQERLDSILDVTVSEHGTRSCGPTAMPASRMSQKKPWGSLELPSGLHFPFHGISLCTILRERAQHRQGTALSRPWNKGMNSQPSLQEEGNSTLLQGGSQGGQWRMNCCVLLRSTEVILWFTKHN